MIDRDEAEAAVREELVRSGMPGRPNRLAEDIVNRVLALDFQPPDDLASITLTPQSHGTRRYTARMIREGSTGGF